MTNLEKSHASVIFEEVGLCVGDRGRERDRPGLGASTGDSGLEGGGERTNGARSLVARRRGVRLPGVILPVVLDIVDPVTTTAAAQRIQREIGPLDLAVLNAGTHRAMSAQKFDAAAVKSLVDVNLMGTVNCLSAILPTFIDRRSGKIAVVASVAGYRGLPTAAAYGATKAPLINMCEALKPELDRFGVGLTLVNPGFVDTPLTRKNKFPMPFIISADEAADIILRGLDKGRFEIVFPWRMAVAMKLLRILPYRAAFWLTERMLPKTSA